MPLKITLLLYLTLLPYISLGQKTLVGQVVDASTQDPLPFVNIGLVDKNIGTVTDEEGYFQLEVDPLKYGKANLRFSMIGYESKTFLLEEYLQNELTLGNFIITDPLLSRASKRIRVLRSFILMFSSPALYSCSPHFKA